MLVIDGIQNVSMANGLVRIQVAQVGADGKQKGVGEIAIPASQYGNVVQALTQAGQNLQQRLQDQQKQQAGQDQQTSQQAAADPAEQGDNFQF
jgi:hypothetical protein